MPNEQVRYAFPKYRVFIFGIEVTDDTISINVESHVGSTPNTCHITLLNELDKYIATTRDIAKLSGLTTEINIPWMNKARASTQSVSQTSTGPRVKPNDIYPQRKLDILTAKYNAVQDASTIKRTSPTGAPIEDQATSQYYGKTIKSFPMADGAPIFNVMDPVRVAMRDPFDCQRWYWHFSGFVSDMVDNTTDNNTKTLTIVVEDVTKLFRYTRVAINPGIVDAKIAVQQEDIRVQSFYASFLRGLNLPEIFFTLIFGPDKAGTDKIISKNVSGSGSSNLSTALRGIGHFAFDSSSYCTFGPAPSEEDRGTRKSSVNDGTLTSLIDVKYPRHLDKLSQWQTLIDHEVQPSDMYTMATQQDRESGVISDRASNLSSNAEMLDIDDVIGYIGMHPHEYPVDGGKLMVLVPNSLGLDNAKIMLEAIINGYPLNSEFHSAGSIMGEVVERIQFAMYCSPKGDIIIEPPLFDLDPDDFGMEEDFAEYPTRKTEYFAATQNVVGEQSVFNVDGTTSVVETSTPTTFSLPIEDAQSILQTGQDLLPGNARVAFGDSYIVLKRDTYGWESAFIDEKVYTMAVCAHDIVQGWPDIGSMGIVGDLALKRLEDLIPLYGIRPLTVTARGYIASREAATLFASIKLNQLNADAHTASIQHVPNIRLWLNRPIYVEGRNFIGRTKQISHSITWGAAGSMDTTSDLDAIRTWDGAVDKDKPTQPIYTTIGGNGGQAINYAILWKLAAVPKKEDRTSPGSIDQNRTQKVEVNDLPTIPTHLGKKVQ